MAPGAASPSVVERIEKASQDLEGALQKRWLAVVLEGADDGPLLQEFATLARDLETMKNEQETEMSLLQAQLDHLHLQQKKLVAVTDRRKQLMMRIEKMEAVVKAQAVHKA